MERLWKSLYDENDAENQKTFFQVGGHLAVVSVMKERLHCRMIQIRGICVLQNATKKNTCDKSNVAKVGGIHVILAAVEKFPLDKSVVHYGFWVLCSLVYGNDANADLLVMDIGGVPFLMERMAVLKANADLLVTKIRAIPFLMEIMAEFKHDQDIMLRACELVRNLAAFEELREAIVDAKALTALCAAIESQKNNPLIQNVVRQTMKLLLV